MLLHPARTMQPSLSPPPRTRSVRALIQAMPLKASILVAPRLLDCEPKQPVSWLSESQGSHGFDFYLKSLPPALPFSQSIRRLQYPISSSMFCIGKGCGEIL